MNKRLGIFIDYLQDTKFRGGAERFHYELAKGLSLSHQLDVYYFYNELHSPLENVNLIHTESERENVSAINSKDYDSVIYPYMSKNNYISLHHLHSRYYRVKKIRKWYELFLSCIFESKKYKTFDASVAYEKECLMANKKILVCSEILKRDFVESYQIPEEKIKVIYPGVNIVEGAKLCDKEVFTFGLSALGFHKKGGFMALFAAALLKIQGKKFKIRVIYNKWQKNILLRAFLFLFGLTKNFEFVGFQQNMDHFFQSAHCLLMPSNEETFGMTALEAMANERFVIVSDCCGISEIIIDGENGFVFEFAKNPIWELYKKMKFVIENRDEDNKICERAYQTAREYSWTRTVSEVESVIFD